MKVLILKKGCSKETPMYDELIRKMSQQGIEKTNYLEETDYLLYITCAGSGPNIDKCMKDLVDLEFYSRRHDIKIIVVGCLATKLGFLLEHFKNIPHVKIISNRDWVIPAMNYISDMNKRNTYKEKLRNRTRYIDQDGIFIQFDLQEGCTNKCSFCKVHYMDQKLTSIPFEIALEYLTDMIRNKGTKVVYLNGDNPTLYGIDLYGRKRLHEFIHELSKVEGLERIGIGEQVAGNMYSELFNEIITNPKVVNVSFQLETASDRLLRLMNRNYTMEEYDYYVRRIIEAGKYVDTVLMSAFPTETQEDMDYTLKYLKERGIITRLICQYMDFPHVIPSSELEQYPNRVKREHTRYLKNGIREINYDIYMREMSNQNRLIYLRGKAENCFCNPIDGIVTIPSSKRFDDLVPGTIITEAPQRLVKCHAKIGVMAYKIK